MGSDLPHATDFDRSRGNVNPTVYGIEKRGMDTADHIITVSDLTREIVIEKYHIDPNKVSTVHNAVEPLANADTFVKEPRKDKIVTFLGRITMFMTGILMFMYGQWSISWDSAHFDSILTKNIPAHTYILANYYLMLAFNVICFVLTTPYFFFGTKIIYLHLTAFLFNTGCNIILLLFCATFNNKRVDLSRSSAMTYTPKILLSIRI